MASELRMKLMNMKEEGSSSSRQKNEANIVLQVLICGNFLRNHISLFKDAFFKKTSVFLLRQEISMLPPRPSGRCALFLEDEDVIVGRRRVLKTVLFLRSLRDEVLYLVLASSQLSEAQSLECSPQLSPISLFLSSSKCQLIENMMTNYFKQSLG